MNSTYDKEKSEAEIMKYYAIFTAVYYRYNRYRYIIDIESNNGCSLSALYIYIYIYIYICVCCKVLYFILSDDDIEIGRKFTV